MGELEVDSPTFNARIILYETTILEWNCRVW
jgi:hypothetical protein